LPLGQGIRAKRPAAIDSGKGAAMWTWR
jgi:hypothetical protein